MYALNSRSRVYDQLLAVLRQPEFRDGEWQLLEYMPAWQGNRTSDCFLAFAWQGGADARFIVPVNYAPNQSQRHVRLPFVDLGGKQWRLQDLLAPAAYDWNGDDLQTRGLFVDMTPWQACVFNFDRCEFPPNRIVKLMEGT